MGNCTSDNNAVSIIETDYGYFIKPYKRIVSIEFEALFQIPNNILFDGSKTIFIPYTLKK